jgi:TonB family protein
MKRICTTSLLAFLLASPLWIAALPIAAQQPATPDPELEAATSMIGQALFLRCLCSDDNLTYDATGKISANVKKVDWTVSGVNIQKVSRKGTGAIELNGVRVAVHFATDRHEFDRKPQNDEAVRVTILTSEDPRAFEQALHAVFAQGIDRELQLATPPYWQHYFDPSLKWDDDLNNTPIVSIPTATQNSTIAVVTHRVDMGYTIWAARGQIAGSVHLRLVIDTQGNARRIAIATPLGYGLDEKAVEAVEKYHFTPATSQGKPVNSNVTMDEGFKFVPISQ